MNPYAINILGLIKAYFIVSIYTNIIQENFVSFFVMNRLKKSVDSENYFAIRKLRYPTVTTKVLISFWKKIGSMTC